MREPSGGETKERDSHVEICGPLREREVVD